MGSKTVKRTKEGAVVDAPADKRQKKITSLLPPARESTTLMVENSDVDLIGDEATVHLEVAAANSVREEDVRIAVETA